MLEIEFKFPDWAAQLKAAEGEINLFIAAQIQFNRGMLFDQEGGYNGHPKWKSLAFRNGQILSNRGALRQSIAPFNPNGTPGPDGTVTVAGDVISIGTTLAYARLMNDGTANMPGGVLRPKNAKALKIPLPKGKRATPLAKTLRKTARTLLTPKPGGGMDRDKFLFVKWVRIPARNFTNWNDQDQAELDAALKNKIAEVLNRGGSR